MLFFKSAAPIIYEKNNERKNIKISSIKIYSNKIKYTAVEVINKNPKKLNLLIIQY
jgi:hypothetical protein